MKKDKKPKPKPKPCPICNGSGISPRHGTTCGYCNGWGTR